MIAIYKREVKSFFTTVIGFLFIAAMLLFFGIYSVAYNVVSGAPYLSYTLQSMLFLFMISIPVLTMRILAEERKQKIDQLILTSPVSVGKVVVGKFLACATIFMIPVLVMAIMPFVYNMFGDFTMKESYTALLGYTLFGLACIAVTIFVSSFVENQIIAVVLSFVTIFILFMMDGICSLISQTGNILTKILSCFAFYDRFTALSQGTFDLTAVFYFVSVIALMLFLTTQNIQKRRYQMSVKNLSLSAFSMTGIILAIAVTVGANYGLGKVPGDYVKYDVSWSQLYTLTDQSKEELTKLTEDITFTMYASEKDVDPVVKELLTHYEEASSHIKVSYINPTENPQFAKQFDGEEISQGSIVVESAKRHKVVAYSDLIKYDIDYQTYQQTATGFDGEGQLTSAIAAVTTDDLEKIYVIQGHKEVDIESTFTDAIKKANIDYENINLLEQDEIPDSIAGIIINTPQIDYTKEDAKKIIDYLNKGGKAFITCSYVGKELPNFESIFSEFGLSIQSGYVVENNKNNYVYDQLTLLPNVEGSTVTSSLKSNNRIIVAPDSQGIVVPEAEDDSDITYTKLLTSSENSFVRSDMTNNQLKMSDSDIPGPICIGVEANKKIDDEKSAQLYLFGTCYIFNDNMNTTSADANLELFTNIISRFAGLDVNIAIPVKSLNPQNLVMPQAKVLVISFVLTTTVPLTLIIAGIVIWVRRKRR